VTTAPTVRSLPTADLGPAQHTALRAFLEAAYAGRFGAENWAHALGGVHVLATVDGELAGHAAVVQRQLLLGADPVRTGFVEAVATAASLRRRGVGTAVMTEVERLVTGGHELGALAASEDGRGLYAARGWLPWTGPLAALTPDGVVPTRQAAVFVLPTPATPVPLDTGARLVCDWRRGGPW
jgi:aminoglycoside 2'-N-acetyltransferase I